jgi:hypothetical protein
MKKIVTAFMMTYCAGISAYAQELPKEWTKEFVITLNYHGSMSGGYTNVRYTYDSVIYNSTPSHSEGPKKKIYLLKPADRAEILKKLREFKVDKIKAEDEIHAVHDGWSQSICLGLTCIEGGTSVEMDENNKNRFLDAYRFLEEFAMNKGRKAK